MCPIEYDEMCRANLAGLGCLLRDLERRLRAVRHKVSFDIVDLRGLDERRDLRRRKMRLLKLLRRGEVRHE